MKFLIISCALGAAVVLQNTLNRETAYSWGLTKAVTLNAIIFVVLAGALWLWANFFPDSLPEIYRLKSATSLPSKWFFLPGIFGFLLVTLSPYCISQIGAAAFFLFLVCSQMIVSFLWDSFAQSIPISGLRVTGIFFALIGASLIAASQVKFR